MILAKYFKHYSQEKNDYKNKPMQMLFETWNKNPKSKREKGYYFKSNDIFNFKTVYDYSFLKSIENIDFKQAFNFDLDSNSIKNDFNPINNPIDMSYLSLEQLKESHLDSEVKEQFISTSLNENNTHEILPRFEYLNNLDEVNLDFLAEFFTNEFQENLNFKSYLEIKKYFDSFRHLFIKILRELRKIKEYTVYKDQTVCTYFKHRLNLENIIFSVESSSDGSCLYHSISIILFGEESYTDLIKMASIFINFEFKDYFETILKAYQYELNFEVFVVNSCKKNE